MATISPRKNKSGFISWRVFFRRKGLKPFITTFSCKEKAEKFAKEYEKKYCLDPENFTYDRLIEQRKREFERQMEGK